MVFGQEADAAYKLSAFPRGTILGLLEGIALHARRLSWSLMWMAATTYATGIRRMTRENCNKDWHGV